MVICQLIVIEALFPLYEEWWWRWWYG